ncbi:MFS transporter [Paenarthrobacter sp. YAF11_1]|uniref:MFS transporter n=1 Tax=Paenarthrobacter sp. YAF11_1 TaxID=3233074 RepID=UPI003F96B68C
MTTMQPQSPAPLVPTESSVVPDAPLNPAAPPSKLLIPAVVLAGFGLYFGSLSPLVVTIALRAAQIDLEGKALGLSAIMAVGALASTVATPIAGSLSDRTRGRFGKRRPWLIGGSLVALLGLLVVGFAPSITVAAIGYAVAQIGFAGAIVAFLALIPELVPDHLRARVSGLIGLVTSMAVLLSVALVTQLASVPALMMALPGAVAVLAVLVVSFVIRKADKGAAPGSFGRYSFGDLIRSFWINPVKNRDYAFNWASRFMFGIAMGGLVTYAVYFLVDAVKLDIGTATGIYAQATIIATPISILCFIISGWLSDRLNRRKAFAASAALIMSSSFIVAAVTQSVEGFFTAFIISTIGQATYLTVDLAIAAEVVPDPKNVAKAMSVYQLSAQLPGSIVPIVGALILGTTGNNYALFFLICAACALVGGIAVLFVKRVR